MTTPSVCPSCGRHKSRYQYVCPQCDDGARWIDSNTVADVFDCLNECDDGELQTLSHTGGDELTRRLSAEILRTRVLFTDCVMAS